MIMLSRRSLDERSSRKSTPQELLLSKQLFESLFECHRMGSSPFHRDSESLTESLTESMKVEEDVQWRVRIRASVFGVR